MDFPISTSWLSGPLVHIMPQSLCSIGGNIVRDSGTAASSTWPSARRILYVPFRLASPMLAKQMFVYAGTTWSGANHVEMGLYTEDGTRIVTTGSTLLSGTISSIQAVDMSDTLIGPGVFYMALALDTATDHVIRYGASTSMTRVLGLAQETPGVFGLPATATMIAVTQNYIPLFGVSGRTFI